jgi:hypothetical protein
MTTSRDEAVTTEEHAAPPEAWDVIADGYDRYVAPQEVDLANEALRLVGLQPGERCLDVAAGTGGLGLPAARQGAQVLATAPAADRRGAEGCPRRAHGGAASIHLGPGDVGLGAVRQPDPRHAGRRPH